EVAARSRADEAIHLEHFAADPAANSAPAGGFEVQLASSGVVLQVPANTSLASGSSNVHVGPDRGVTGTVRFTGMVATAAHLHEAPPGANGPAIVPLLKAGDGMFAVPTETSLTPSQYASYLAGNLYVNVHSATYPAGEIRAQLRPK
ncbi:MAG: CHRD domain-containing protein, partial [Janthinobacterium sp.]